MARTLYPAKFKSCGTMQIKKPRDKIRIYLDWLTPLEDLPNTDKGAMFNAILHYGFDGKIIELPEHLRLAFKMLKFQIDKSLEEESVNLYVVKLYNHEECFFKIGVAKNIKKRIQSFTGLGYDAIRMESLEIRFDDREQALSFEKKLHDELGMFQHYPKKKFGGQFECFSDQCFDSIDMAIRKLRKEVEDE